ncbi:APC family permease [Aminobacter sp. AP02]|uniref:APC family permease n=1 Tax=Aminobacter sp. AP02 TaxID=2135737 RepID=UPI000D6AFE8B|nr:APC family permease [Aminobacter sp. AP02]PWK66407.1 amino acid transporter [Aminobacter sp. AP02]
MVAITETDVPKEEMRRALTWKGAFWIASGAPAFVLFSIGGLAGTVGKLAIVIWAISMVMGFVQSFTYAEIAGLYPNKSGGASIYGASAWLRYGKFIAPLSVWCNWVAWTSVLSLGSSIAAAYVLNTFAPIPSSHSSEVLSWVTANANSLVGLSQDEQVAKAIAALTPNIREWTFFGGQIGPVSFSLNAAFWIGAAFMLLVFSIQHRGIHGTANVQKYLGLAVIIPLAVVGIVPILLGKVDAGNFLPMIPNSGEWNLTSWTVILSGLFIAGWSTYGFETAICYTREFKDPANDTYRAILSAGILCLALFIIVPFTFQGVLGLEGVTDPAIVDGSGVARALAFMVGGGPVVLYALILMMVLAVLLSIMTSMAGSSRTLYQGSVDGWLPRYLGRLNHHGAPTNAMWTDLVFNLFVLAVAVSDATSFFFLLAVSNVCYMIFNFLNLNAGWIHRIDSPSRKRPYRAPTLILGAGAVLSYVNCLFMGAGAKMWHPAALWAGLGTALLIIPVFWYRHYVQDGGRFPSADAESQGERRAGVLPYVALLSGLGIVLLANWIFVL